MAPHKPGQEDRIENAEKKCIAIMRAGGKPIGSTREYFLQSDYGPIQSIKHKFNAELGVIGKTKQQQSVTKLPPNESYIYLFHCKYSGERCFKVGRTTNPNSRFGQYRTCESHTQIIGNIIIWDISQHI